MIPGYCGMCQTPGCPWCFPPKHTLTPKQEETFKRSFANAHEMLFRMPPSPIEPAPTREPWTRERYLQEFRELTAKMLEITTKKNNDYGGTTDPFKNFRSFEELGILVRMSDKFARLRTAIVEKRAFEVADESVEDTCIDLANYALLLLCYRRGA